jgi:hypothetical protein
VARITDFRLLKEREEFYEEISDLLKQLSDVMGVSCSMRAQRQH